MPVPERTASKSWARTSARERIRQRYFPNVLLTTHEEKKVHLYDDLIKDKVVVLNFFYATCNGICVPTTANLVRVQALLREHMTHDLFMYSFTLKPSEDSPGVLRDYATRFRVGPGWLFLTGDPADLELIRRRTGFTDPDPVRDANKLNHTGMVRYGNEPLTLWGACPGMSKPESVAKSIMAVMRT